MHRVITRIDPRHRGDRAELSDSGVGDLRVVHDIGVIAHLNLKQDGAGADLAIGAEAGVLQFRGGIDGGLKREGFVGVIGRSGAGKSTLLRMINRLAQPAEGRILYNSVDVTALRGKELRQWRARSAMIFQQFNLIGRLDVLTNVLMGRLATVSPV